MYRPHLQHNHLVVILKALDAELSQVKALCPELIVVAAFSWSSLDRAALPLQDSANGAIKFDHKGKQALELTSYLCKEVLFIN